MISVMYMLLFFLLIGNFYSNGSPETLEIHEQGQLINCNKYEKNCELVLKTASLSLKTVLDIMMLPLAAFVGGESAHQKMRGFFEDKSPIQGWRCLECGYSELSESGINYYVAQLLVPEILFQACVDDKLLKAISDVLKLNLPNAKSVISSVKMSITGSNININNRDGWMRPCPSCLSEDTAAYSWKYSSGRFLPGKGNLPIKSIRRKWWHLWKST